MKLPLILSVKVQSNAEVVLARQRAQAVAEVAGFDLIKQTSFATAVSELARNAVQFAAEACIAFSVETIQNARYLMATVSDRGKGILEVHNCGGEWNKSIVFQGEGIRSARKLVKFFAIQCPPSGGTTVQAGLLFPPALVIRPETISAWGARIAQQKPRNLLEEVHHRNQELMVTLETLQQHESALEQQIAHASLLNAELARSKETLESRVLERTESLLVSNEELRAFSYVVSHDLRAPLRAINGYVRILLEDHFSEENREATEFGKAILLATERMDELIQDLVIYTQAGKAPMPLREIDSRIVIDELIAQCGPVTPAGARITIAGDFPRVIANETVLQSVLLNLYENAIKFRNSPHQPSVCFRGVCGPKSLRVWVEDDGLGIAPEHHQRIFKVFERLHGNEFPGTGIGLALVKRWMGRLEGSVGVESNLGQGSRFWVELPLASKENPPIPGPS